MHRILSLMHHRASAHVQENGEAVRNSGIAVGSRTSTTGAAAGGAGARSGGAANGVGSADGEQRQPKRGGRNGRRQSEVSTCGW